MAPQRGLANPPPGWGKPPETGGRNINREDGRGREFLRKKVGKNKEKRWTKKEKGGGGIRVKLIN